MDFSDLVLGPCMNAFAVRLFPRKLIAQIAEGTVRKLNHK